MGTVRIYPILLAGGSGTRLWPLSTQQLPKQFVPLFNDMSLFQITMNRFIHDDLFYPPLIVTNSNYVDIIHEQMNGITASYEILAEPCSRDTGPAIALATTHIMKKDPEAIMALIPADHYIPETEKFLSCVLLGLNHVSQNIVIFGITPTSAETGYGYIEKGLSLNCNDSCYQVKSFAEKPSLEIAKQYITDGNYYWNSGIYLYKGSVLMDEFEKNCDYIYNSIFTIVNNPTFEGFESLQSISIDYAITEKSEIVVMVETDIIWSDVGSWYGLWNISEKDTDGNCIDGNAVCKYTTNSLIRGTKRIVTIGVTDMIVVETNDTILVMKHGESQRIKTVAKELQ